MAYDGLVTHAVVASLQPFVGGRITKIYQPDTTDLILHLRSRAARGRLLVSINAAFARLHLTDWMEGNPQAPPMFCMLLRKHLEGSVIAAIEQPGFERIVHLDVFSRNELGDLTEKRLIVELMGRRSNVILVDKGTGRIIDSMKHLTSAVNRYRTVLPGDDYIAPPDQGKLNPLAMSSDDLLRRLQWNDGRLDRQIVSLVEGFSPVIGKEIIQRAHLQTPEAVAAAFSSVQQALQNGIYQPNSVTEKDGKADYSVIALTHLAGESQFFPNVNDMLDRFYALKAENDAVRQKAGDLAHFIALELKKNKTKLGRLEKTVEAADAADNYRLFGELLTANLHVLKKGAREAVLNNFYDPEQQPVRIPLEARQAPAENAQAYFKKYAKAKTARKVVRQQIVETKTEIDYFDELAQQMKSASLKDIAEIREELEEGGYLKKKNHARSFKKSAKPDIDHYYASDGTLICVGKNNKQNDYLTTKLAGRDDVWLHTKNIPGSHVVIKSAAPSEAVLREAAGLAAFFSKSRMSSSVPVDYTTIKYVKKPSGAKPGFVIYTDNRTIYVTPEEALVMKLKKKPTL
ncbi:MAG: NFACT RNA binding domain-containing protein [Sporolactobacillus sp.]